MKDETIADRRERYLTYSSTHLTDMLLDLEKAYARLQVEKPKIPADVHVGILAALSFVEGRNLAELRGHCSPTAEDEHRYVCCLAALEWAKEQKRSQKRYRVGGKLP
jgi:hypothetical protein